MLEWFDVLFDILLSFTITSLLLMIKIVTLLFCVVFANLYNIFNIIDDFGDCGTK